MNLTKDILFSFEQDDLLRNEFENSSDRAIAIVSAAFLDEVLGKILKEFFIDDDSHDRTIFTGNGFLSTFSAKINLSYRLGLISEYEYKLINKIRSIRNIFAHELSDLNFSTQSISDKCKNINPPYNLSPVASTNYSKSTGEVVGYDRQVPDPSNPKKIFEHCIIMLMHILGSRQINARQDKRQIANNYESFDEPATVLFELMKSTIAANEITINHIEKNIISNKERISELKDIFSKLSKPDYSTSPHIAVELSKIAPEIPELEESNNIMSK